MGGRNVIKSFIRVALYTLVSKVPFPLNQCWKRCSRTKNKASAQSFCSMAHPGPAEHQASHSLLVHCVGSIGLWALWPSGELESPRIYVTGREEQQERREGALLFRIQISCPFSGHAYSG